MTMTKSALRNALRNAFGAGQYRITSTGEIHIHGQMPNSTSTGWYLYGWMDDAETIARLNRTGPGEIQYPLGTLGHENNFTPSLDTVHPLG